jgi:hypothetical protein
MAAVLEAGLCRHTKLLRAHALLLQTLFELCRYQSDLSTRGSRLQQLQNTWIARQQQQQQHSVGGKMPPVPLTTEQKDMAQAVNWYKGMGWQDAAESGTWR